MKRAGAIPRIMWGVVVGLAVWWLAEHQACLKLAQGNVALREKLSPMDVFIAENRRLSNLLGQANSFSSPLTGSMEGHEPNDQPTEELLRLRAEVNMLCQQSNEIKTLRDDTRQVRTALETSLKAQSAGKTVGIRQGTNPNSPLEILKAEYWTDNVRMDVTDELRDRIRDDGLKAVASNNIKGDPDFGQVKHLTIEYRFGGLTMTNEFREGDIVVLPRE